MNLLRRFLGTGLLLAFAAGLTAQTPEVLPPKGETSGKTSTAQGKRAGAPAIRPHHADLQYGPHARNTLDLWLAESGRPAPLLVYIHGGGFVGGDKSAVNYASIRKALETGVSFASINYRFRNAAPIQVILRDCARAIQFLRWKSREFNLDEARVASMGGSAGAGTSLWLAFHDDLADPNHADPVLRESSRITAAGSTAGQATYDVLRWQEFLGDVVAKYSNDSDIAAFYGVKTAAVLQTPEGRRIRSDVDMHGLITKDDPPVYLVASSRHDALQSRGDLNHSAKHSMAVKKRCDEVGVQAVLKIVAGAPNEDSGNLVDFLLEKLGAHGR